MRSLLALTLVSSSLFAEAQAARPQGGLVQFVPLILIFGIFYFLIIRPQSKRAKEQQTFISALKRGDEVVTAGGILGRVTKVSDSYIVLALSDTVEITLQKSSIVSALPKGTLKSI